MTTQLKMRHIETTLNVLASHRLYLAFNTYKSIKYKLKKEVDEKKIDETVVADMATYTVTFYEDGQVWFLDKETDPLNPVWLYIWDMDGFDNMWHKLEREIIPSR